MSDDDVTRTEAKVAAAFGELCARTSDREARAIRDYVCAMLDDHAMAVERRSRTNWPPQDDTRMRAIAREAVEAHERAQAAEHDAMMDRIRGARDTGRDKRIAELEAELERVKSARVLAIDAEVDAKSAEVRGLRAELERVTGERDSAVTRAESAHDAMAAAEAQVGRLLDAWDSVDRWVSERMAEVPAPQESTPVHEARWAGYSYSRQRLREALAATLTPVSADEPHVDTCRDHGCLGCVDLDEPNSVIESRDIPASGALISSTPITRPARHCCPARAGGMACSITCESRKQSGGEAEVGGIAAIFGKWPGDETDEQLAEAVHALDGDDGLRARVEAACAALLGHAALCERIERNETVNKRTRDAHKGMAGGTREAVRRIHAALAGKAGA